MGKVKTGIWIFIIVVLMLLFFQNQSIFTASRSLKMDLYFVKYQTPELPNGLFYLAALVIGLLISYLFALGDRFKARRAVKRMSAVLDSQRQEVTTLKKEIEALKNIATPDPPPAIELPMTPAETPTPPPGESRPSASGPEKLPGDGPEQAASGTTAEKDRKDKTETEKGAEY